MRRMLMSGAQPSYITLQPEDGAARSNDNASIFWEALPGKAIVHRLLQLDEQLWGAASLNELANKACLLHPFSPCFDCTSCLVAPVQRQQIVPQTAAPGAACSDPSQCPGRPAAWRPSQPARSNLSAGILANLQQTACLATTERCDAVQDIGGS